MFVAIVFFLLASTTNTVIVHAKDRCCAPNHITRDTFLTNKLWTSYIDFNQMKALEDWDGRNGVNFVLLNLDTEIKYTRMVDGTCKMSSFSNKYARCVPADASYYDVEPENGIQLDGWTGTLPGNVTIDLVTRAEDCIAHSVMQTFHTGARRTFRFFNTQASIVDSKVFDKDIQDCL